MIGKLSISTIVIIADIYDISSGGGRQLAYTLPDLNSRIQIIVILTKEGTLAHFLRSKGITVRILTCNSVYDLSFPIRVFKFIKSACKSSFLVHTHTERTTTLINPLFFALGVPVVSTLHRSLLSGSPWYANKLKALLFLQLENFVLRYATSCTIAISHHLASELIQKRSMQPQKVVVIHNSVPLPSLSVLERISHANRPEYCSIQISSVLRASFEKGPDFLFSNKLAKALSLFHKNIVIRIVGLNMSLELKNLINQVESTFPLLKYDIIPSSDRVLDDIAGSDLYIQPSRSEAFCLAAVEASFLGIPILTNSLSVFDEVLANYQLHASACLFAPSLDYHQLYKIISHLVLKPKTQSPFSSMTLSAWSHYPYNPSDINSELLLTYDRILSKTH